MGLEPPWPGCHQLRAGAAPIAASPEPLAPRLCSHQRFCSPLGLGLPGLVLLGKSVAPGTTNPSSSPPTAPSPPAAPAWASHWAGCPHLLSLDTAVSLSVSAIGLATLTLTLAFMHEGPEEGLGLKLSVSGWQEPRRRPGASGVSAGRGRRSGLGEAQAGAGPWAAFPTRPPSGNGQTRADLAGCLSPEQPNTAPLPSS